MRPRSRRPRIFLLFAHGSAIRHSTVQNATSGAERHKKRAVPCVERGQPGTSREGAAMHQSHGQRNAVCEAGEPAVGA